MNSRFVEKMSKFCEQARNQVDVLTAMASKMDELYTTLAEYFVFDKQKYTLEEFMSDVKAFKDQFIVSLKNITIIILQEKTFIGCFNFRNHTPTSSRSVKPWKNKLERARPARSKTRRGR